ncbi:GIY-YIG nuclease family protein [Candidatus Uhrbacteria bacterium]|nr:GIY-YIG nuclease family protein [Candidatus Uhrbacteria bacterium]
MNAWFIYLLKCRDNTLYTGITTDLDARVRAHNAGKGAKYTRGRIPVKVVWTQKVSTQSEALIQEAQIKKLSREQKKELIKQKKGI